MPRQSSIDAGRPTRLASASDVALTAVVCAVLLGCGDPTQAQELQRRPILSLPASSVGSPTVSNEQLFSWAQRQYPMVFGTSVPERFAYSLDGKAFDVAGYSTGNYLGVADGEVFLYGPITGLALTNLGAVSQFADQVCAHESCSSPPRINACAQTAAQRHDPGSTINLTYLSHGAMSGEVTYESAVRGPGVFEGQAVVELLVTRRGAYSAVANGLKTAIVTADSERSFEQALPGGTVRTLGNLTDHSSTTTVSDAVTGRSAMQPSVTSKLTKSVFVPPVENAEFTLAQGASLDKNITVTSSTLAGPPILPAPTTSTASFRYTFEGMETVTVAAGTFRTCRYTMRPVAGGTGTRSWYMVGSGVLVKSGDAAMPDLELKAGMIDGGGL